jgi:hypothetical protein
LLCEESELRGALTQACAVWDVKPLSAHLSEIRRLINGEPEREWEPMTTDKLLRQMQEGNPDRN